MLSCSIIPKATEKRTKETENVETENKNVGLLGMCFHCTVTVKTAYICSMCSKIFHFTCIPKNHLVHAPEESEDEGLFVCHICFKIVSDSEGELFDSLVS